MNTAPVALLPLPQQPKPTAESRLLPMLGRETVHGTLCWDDAEERSRLCNHASAFSMRGFAGPDRMRGRA